MNSFLPLLPTAIALVGFPISLLLAVTPYHIEWVEEETTKQCLANDWPADKHDIHIAWCTHNGYPVKSVSYTHLTLPTICSV